MSQEPIAAVRTRETGASPAEREYRPGRRTRPYVSVIIRVTERPARLEGLYDEYAPALRALGRSFEFVFAIEPWARALAEPLYRRSREGAPIRVIELGRAVGEATQLRVAAERSEGSIILTLPAYRRVDAAAFPELIRRVERGADLAIARRWPRSDRLANRIQSWAFNRILRLLVGQGIRDVACGVQAMRPEVLRETPLYGDFFRFLPVLAGREGFEVVEVDAPQHPADRRTPLYSPGVYVRRAVDVLGLFFLVRFTEKPLRFFGLVGTGLALLGLLVLGVLVVQRQLGGEPLAGRPMLLAGVTALTLGVQVIALGLIGEMIVHLHAARGRWYRVVAAEDGDEEKNGEDGEDGES